MFCALNGATAMPRCRSHAQIAVVIQLLPAWDATPPTKMGFALTGRTPPPSAMLELPRPWQTSIPSGRGATPPKPALSNSSPRSPTTRFRPRLPRRIARASPYNLVHLILPGADYAGAAARLRAVDWRRHPCPRRRARALRLRTALRACRRRASPWCGAASSDSAISTDYGAVVHRHERTLDAPKADRLELLRHTRAQFGSISMMYPDAGRRRGSSARRRYRRRPARAFRATINRPRTRCGASRIPTGSPRCRLRCATSRW